MTEQHPQHRQRHELLIGIIFVCIFALLAIWYSFSSAATLPLTRQGSVIASASSASAASKAASSSAAAHQSYITRTIVQYVGGSSASSSARSVQALPSASRVTETRTARSFFSIFGKPKDGQVLMYSNGKLVWTDVTFGTTIENLTTGTVNVSGYGRKPTYPVNGSSVLRGAAPEESPVRHYGGGGGGSNSSSGGSSTVTNVYNTYTTTGGSGSGIATFIGTTPLTTYNGQFTSGLKTGYDAANAICDAAYTGSHFCRTDEILQTIATKNISSLFSGVPDAWMAEGPPGYTADSNDCRGWTSSNLAHLGPWWDFNTSGGGIGYLTNCSTTKPLACCKVQ